MSCRRGEYETVHPTPTGCNSELQLTKIPSLNSVADLAIGRGLLSCFESMFSLKSRNLHGTSKVKCLVCSGESGSASPGNFHVDPWSRARWTLEHARFPFGANVACNLLR
jgi:hypothetical protein